MGRCDGKDEPVHLVTVMASEPTPRTRNQVAQGWARPGSSSGWHLPWDLAHICECPSLCLLGLFQGWDAHCLPGHT